MSDKLKTGPVVSEAVDKWMKKYYLSGACGLGQSRGREA